MRACRVLLAVLLLSPLALAADIVPFTGDPIKGDFVQLTEKAVVYKVDGKEVTKPIKEVLRLELREPTRPAADRKFARVELTDGTVLLVEPAWKWKKNDVELKLLSGPTFTLSVAQISNILNSGENKAHEQDWVRQRVPKNRGKSVVVQPDLDGKGKPIGDRASSYTVTFGEGHEAGDKITYVISDDIEDTSVKVTKKLSDLRGFIFKHVLPPRAPATSVRLFDTADNRVMVSELRPGPKGVSVTTPAGVKIDYTYDQVAKLDYAPGVLTYLVDVDDDKRTVKESPYLLDPGSEKLYKQQPVTVGGTTTKRGQIFIPEVEVTYELGGGFQRFQANVGENTRLGDDDAKVPGLTIATEMVIEGDGRELASLTISPTDKVRHKELTLNVKDVQKLKIKVKAVSKDGSRLNVKGTSLALAEARVIK